MSQFTYTFTKTREPKSTGGVRYECPELGTPGHPATFYAPQEVARAIGGGAYAGVISMTLSAPSASAKVRSVR